MVRASSRQGEGRRFESDHSYQIPGFRVTRISLVFLIFLVCPLHAYSDWQYDWPGLEFDGSRFTTDIKLRAQLRATSTVPPDFGLDDVDNVVDRNVNRARIKIGGSLWQDGVSYYTEYDFPSSRLLDLRLTAQFDDTFSARFGQWKVPFNRERIDSSGRQQFVDRSISNRWFTLDRQRGLVIFGRLAPGTTLDTTYHLGVLEGTGRNGEGDAEEPMLLGRLDWNFLARPLAFRQSDTDRQREPAGVVSLVTAFYRGPYTAFSSSGGGQLPGYQPGNEDRYRIRQYALESAFQYRGFSWQQELHQKEISDTVLGSRQVARGGYLQAGYFPHQSWKSLPSELEVAVRYARVEPARNLSASQSEWTIGFNWFFKEHDNKLSLDVTRGRGDLQRLGSESYHVYRLQWDFHL